MLESKVNKIMNKTLASNKKELDAAQIQPFCDEVQFGKNGLYLFIAPQGGGKSFNIAKFILMTESLQASKPTSHSANASFQANARPYYNTIVYCSTSDGLDKTLDVFRKKFKTDVKYIDEAKLLPFITHYINRQKHFYSMVKYLNSNGKVIDATLEQLFKKHGCINKVKEYKYIMRKLNEYGNPPYPNNMLLILDDFLGSDLLESKKSPLVKILTKLRHYNITTIISQQSTKGIGRTVRRLASDCALWKGIGYDDFIDLMREIPVKADKDYLWELYTSLKNKHDFVEFHFHCDKYKVNRFD